VQRGTVRKLTANLTHRDPQQTRHARVIDATWSRCDTEATQASLKARIEMRRGARVNVFYAEDIAGYGVFRRPPIVCRADSLASGLLRAKWAQSSHGYAIA
jgi:hypothetical protein